MMFSSLTTVSRRTTLAAISLAAVGASFAICTPALAASSGDLVAATNASRSSAGLPALTENGQLDAVAAAWAQKLAASNVLSHNPAIRTQVTSWSDLGENVGMGASVAALEQAFMASPDHRANILDTNYTQVGVGTATSTYPSCSCTILWVVVDFRRPSTAAAVVAPPANAPSTPGVAPKPPAPPQVRPPTNHPGSSIHSPAVVPSTPPAPHVTPTAPVTPPVVVAPVPSHAVSAPSSEPSLSASASVAARTPSSSASSFVLGSAMTDDSVTPTTGSDPVASVLDFASSLAALT